MYIKTVRSLLLKKNENKLKGDMRVAPVFGEVWIQIMIIGHEELRHRRVPSYGQFTFQQFVAVTLQEFHAFHQSSRSFLWEAAPPGLTWTQVITSKTLSSNKGSRFWTFYLVCKDEVLYGGETHSKRTFEFRNDSVIFPERIQLRERLFQQPLNEYIYVIITLLSLLL